MKFFFQITFLILILLFAGCSPKKESSIPKKYQQLVEIYTELYLLKNLTTINDSTYADSAQIILDQFGFTQNEYEKALSYFNDKPERWELFYQKVLDNLKTKTTSDSTTKQL